MDMMIRFPNLGVELGYVGRSVRIFGFEITFGGMLLALGMLAGLAFIVLEAKRSLGWEDDHSCDFWPDRCAAFLCGIFLGSL